MPTASEIAADPSLLTQCVWRSLASLPPDLFVEADLRALDGGLPVTTLSGPVIFQGPIPGHVFIRSQVKLGPLPVGSTATFVGLALLFPGPPEVLLCVNETPGGYELGAGDVWTAVLVSMIPNDLS